MSTVALVLFYSDLVYFKTHTNDRTWLSNSQMSGRKRDNNAVFLQLTPTENAHLLPVVKGGHIGIESETTFMGRCVTCGAHGKHFPGLCCRETSDSAETNDHGLVKAHY